jgi:hypothetical protein
MKKHKCQFKRTSEARYTCPLQFKEKCPCGKIRWIAGDPISVKTLTEEEFRKKYPNFEYKPPFIKS